MRRLFCVAVWALVCSGCKNEPLDADRRPAWLHEQAGLHNWYVREALNGTPDIRYYDGWFDPETDPKTGGAWRWQSKKSITRLRTRLGDAPVTDMTLTVYGWVPWQDVGFRTNDLDFSVNGHVLETFAPPHESFVHTIFVPKYLLENSEWVDFAITAANTARPRGDWRDLGFCTTGFIWKPAHAS